MNEINDEKIAIFLGAGASVPDGAPTNLLKAYLTPREGLDLDRTRQQRISELLHRLFPDQSDDEPEYPQFEEMLTVIDFALQREETFKDYGGYNEMSVHDAHEVLVLSIAELLTKSLHERNETKHDELIASLYNEDRISPTVFLTTNYDILIDNALTRYFSARNPDLQLPNYGMEHNVEKIEGSTRYRLTHREYSMSDVYLLKLHGSLNWFYCPRCNSVSLTPYIKGGAISVYGPSLCLDCQQHCLPNIIPPTYLKHIDGTHMSQVWNRAEGELKQVDKIIFCGYSLPPADLQVKYLLKRVQINRANRSPLRIVVMNKKCNETEEEWRVSNKITCNQYKRFFGRSNVDYIPRGFEDLVEHGLQLSNR